MSIIDLSLLFSISYDGLKLGKEPNTSFSTKDQVSTKTGQLHASSDASHGFGIDESDLVDS
jgi:hypothetical protein